jgi:zinc protease
MRSMYSKSLTVTFFTYFSVLTIFSSGCSSVVTPIRSDIKRVKEDEIAVKNFIPQKPVQWSLPNGLEVLYLEDNELPTVRGTLYINGGSYLEGDVVAGGVALMGGMLRLGGAGKYKPAELDEVLEKYAAQISSAYTAEYGQISFKCLSNDIEAIFPIFSDIVRRPKFDEKKIELVKSNTIEGILRRKDDPGTIASLALNELVYPKRDVHGQQTQSTVDQSTYGRVAVADDVRKISRKELVKLHNKFVVPQRSLLAVTGKITKNALEKLITQHFGDWSVPDTLELHYPQVTTAPSPGIYFIEGPFAQATVFIGQQGGKRLNPLHHASVVFNEIFGLSGMSSLLSTKIRTEQGLAYSVSGMVGLGVEKGRNLIALQTKAESTGEAVKRVFEILELMQNKEVSDAELSEKKMSLLNSFIFSNEDVDTTISRQAVFKLYGYPQDFDETYPIKIQNVLLSDVQEVAKQFWNYHNAVIVIVGNLKSLESIEKEKVQLPAPFRTLEVKKAIFDEKIRL